MVERSSEILPVNLRLSCIEDGLVRQPASSPSDTPPLTPSIGTSAFSAGVAGSRHLSEHSTLSATLHAGQRQIGSLQMPAPGVTTSGPVYARALIPLTGPNYEIADGEEVMVISNCGEQEHFWRIKSKAGIVEVPAVAMWIGGPNLESINQAIQ
ncbi:unnamed protein product [Protopolystoma xenopodis]|uniref:SH3 domain-containing protein n=1 Tax=Protopolystoma xenopodis TaxID=117903 RepID=A0A3S5AR97_9PLAT|nr:unnamed protein product [Protopolystoma xenopodis]